MGKGDTYRKVDNKKMGKNCDRIFGPTKLNQWPRDKNGNLINEDNNEIEQITGP